MAKLGIFIVTIIAAVSLLVNFFFFQKAKDDQRVVEVVDGDTFQLKSGERVRLMGVDAPESDRCGGQQAKEKLTDLILNKTVKLEESVKENYGRTMALVYENGNLINKTMMNEGWGRPDYRKNSQREVLTSAYHEAVTKKAGLWSFCINPNPPNFPNYPNGCLIKGNIDTATYQKTYHLQTCRQYKQVVLNTAYGDSWFCTEQEAVKAGFERAKGCD